MLKIITVTIVISQFILCFSAGPKAWEPEERTEAGPKSNHEKFLAETKKDAKTIEIVFYGDSITQGWEWNGKEIWQKYYGNLHAVNYGISGDRTQHVLWRLDHGEVEGLHPKLVVLKIGVNNFSHNDTDEEIAKGIRTILDVLHTKMPQTKILLLGILPASTLGKRIKNINSMIAKYDNGNTIRFMDMGPHFEDAAGVLHSNLYVPDHVHLTKDGYQTWAQTMDPLFKQMLGNSQPSGPMPWEPENRNVSLHQQFLKETKDHADDIQIIFYGDSITQGWSGNGKEVWAQHYAPIHAVNYGIGGDRTQHIIWRIQNGEIEGLHPKLIVLKIGTNNLGHGHTDEEIAKGIQTILDLIHTKLPQTKVLLLGVLPRGHRGFYANIKHINSIIWSFEDNQKVYFLDMALAFEDSAGDIKADLYVPDGVHLSAAGYKVWAETMDPLFKHILLIK